MKCSGPFLHSFSKGKSSTFQDQGSFHSALRYLSDPRPVGAVLGQGPPVWTCKSPRTPPTYMTTILCLCGKRINRLLVRSSTSLLPTHIKRKVKKCCPRIPVVVWLDVWCLVQSFNSHPPPKKIVITAGLANVPAMD